MSSSRPTPQDADGLRFGLVWVALGALLLGLLALDLLPHMGIFFARSRDLPTVDQLGKSLGGFSRVLGVTLSMLTVLCVLAVPLTANVYTPKLIEVPGSRNLVASGRLELATRESREPSLYASSRPGLGSRRPH